MDKFDSVQQDLKKVLKYSMVVAFTFYVGMLGWEVYYYSVVAELSISGICKTPIYTTTYLLDLIAMGIFIWAGYKIHKGLTHIQTANQSSDS